MVCRFSLESSVRQYASVLNPPDRLGLFLIVVLIQLRDIHHPGHRSWGTGRQGPEHNNSWNFSLDISQQIDAREGKSNDLRREI